MCCIYTTDIYKDLDKIALSNNPLPEQLRKAIIVKAVLPAKNKLPLIPTTVAEVRKTAGRLSKWI